MRPHHSAWNIFAAARQGHADWAPAWREAEPKSRYDLVIVGGGGHGLATAYYLAKNHGVRNVAILEAGWIGGGNTGRNTTIVRSNYLYPESARLYDFSVRLYEELSKELNFNSMFSQRGIMTLAHSRHDLDSQARWANAMQCNGIDADLLDARQVQAIEPRLNVGPDARYPIHGGFIQRRAGPARHDAVAWGYARAASVLGVDIIQNCEVTGFLRKGASISGVKIRRRGIDGETACDKAALAVSGHSSVLAGLAGFELPITSYALQAMVSEPIKPVLNAVTLSPALGAYWSQSDKGEVVIGGALDHFPSYGQRSSFAITQQVVAATTEMFPSLGRLRLLRQWAGIVDIVQDSTVTICHSGTRELAAIVCEADVLVAAIGRPRFVTADMVRPGATVIDVGINRETEGPHAGKLCGDVDFDAVCGIAGAITPVPGGVGPMTIAMLLANTVRAAAAA